MADSDLEVRVGRVGALLAVGPSGLGFGLKTRGQIPLSALWTLCRFTAEKDLKKD